MSIQKQSHGLRGLSPCRQTDRQTDVYNDVCACVLSIGKITHKFYSELYTRIASFGKRSGFGILYRQCRQRYPIMVRLLPDSWAV